MRKDGGPAFPTEHGFNSEGEQWDKRGMSLRDYFAAAALRGIIGNADFLQEVKAHVMDRMPSAAAAAAYDIADAMLDEHERRPNV